MKLVLSGILENISTRSDGSLKFTLGTQEMDSLQAGNLFQFRGKYLKCLLSDTNITQVEQGVVDSEKMNALPHSKSPSKRLKNVMYLVYKAQRIQVPFEDWYANEMEMHITSYKGILSEYE